MDGWKGMGRRRKSARKTFTKSSLKLIFTNFNCPLLLSHCSRAEHHHQEYLSTLNTVIGSGRLSTVACQVKLRWRIILPLLLLASLSLSVCLAVTAKRSVRTKSQNTSSAGDEPLSVTHKLNPIGLRMNVMSRISSQSHGSVKSAFVIF